MKKDLAEERVSLEALEKRLEGKESGSSFSELVSGVGVRGVNEG